MLPPGARTRALAVCTRGIGGACEVLVGLVGAEGGLVPVVGLVRSVVVLCLWLPLLLAFFLSWRNFGNRRRPGVVSVDLNAGTSV